MAPDPFYADCLQRVVYELNNFGNEFFYPNYDPRTERISHNNIEIRVHKGGVSRTRPQSMAYSVTFSTNRTLHYDVYLFHTTEDINLIRRGAAAGFTYLATTPNVGILNRDVDLSKPF